MENTAPTRMKDDAFYNTSHSTVTGECPSCASMRNYCLVCKIGKYILGGLIVVALVKFIFCGTGGYYMKGGMEYRMDRGSMMMSGSLRDYKSEKGFFKKRFDRDDVIVGTGLIATESTQ